MSEPTAEERATRLRNLSMRPLDEAWQKYIVGEIRAAERAAYERAARVVENWVHPSLTGLVDEVRALADERRET